MFTENVIWKHVLTLICWSCMRVIRQWSSARSQRNAESVTRQSECLGTARAQLTALLIVHNVKLFGNLCKIYLKVFNNSNTAYPSALSLCDVLSLDSVGSLNDAISCEMWMRIKRISRRWDSKWKSCVRNQRKLWTHWLELSWSRQLLWLAEALSLPSRASRWWHHRKTPLRLYCHVQRAHLECSYRPCQCS